MNSKQKAVLKKAKHGKRLTIEAAKQLLTAKQADLYPILEAAEKRKQEVTGEPITYVINYNLNLTNICVNNCRFCGFSRSRNSSDAYLLSSQQLEEHLSWVKKQEQITEICLVSGLHPEFDLQFYLEVVEKIKTQLPDIHLHGITPEELKHALRDTELDFAAGYRRLQEAGLDSVPGTAAEILVPEVRQQICPEKLSTAEWIQAIKAAHQVGLKSTATILYGHLETPAQRLEHLAVLREIQDQTGGFTEFIPLSLIPDQTPLQATGQVSQAPTGREDLLMISVARLFLDNIPNIQASWVKYGPKLAQVMLTAGANDLGGTLFNENISRAAGRETKEYLAPETINDLIKDIGYTPHQRDTLYQPITF